MATGSNFPTSTDSFTDKSAGDYVSVADFNQRSSAIEKIEAAVKGNVGLILLTTATASNSTVIDFTSGFSTTYSNYMVKISNFTPVTDATFLCMRVSQSASFLSGATDYAWVRAVWGATSTNALVADDSDAEIEMAGGISNTSGRVLESAIFFGHPAVTGGRKNFMFDNVYFSSTGEFIRSVGMGGFQANNNPIDGIRFIMSSGNISVGDFRLYGIRN